MWILQKHFTKFLSEVMLEFLSNYVLLRDIIYWFYRGWTTDDYENPNSTDNFRAFIDGFEFTASRKTSTGRPERGSSSMLVSPGLNFLNHFCSTNSNYIFNLDFTFHISVVVSVALNVVTSFSSRWKNKDIFVAENC